ncbi:hypothetical protein EVAR_83430_1 [Eumeta japonica]|uniref:Uncharacterized protein n=1 Tax=Eumeta variegata TaxID=151549 RepID=A0A4C1TYM5_EUMVA|nr:hypothetical protein EVAR_83430_1 [Eumeta japonica]
MAASAPGQGKTPHRGVHTATYSTPANSAVERCLNTPKLSAEHKTAIGGARTYPDIFLNILHGDTEFISRPAIQFHANITQTQAKQNVAYIKRLMDDIEIREIGKDRIMWKSVVCVYPSEKEA